VWLTLPHLRGHDLRRVGYLLVPRLGLGGRRDAVVEALDDHHLRHARGAIIPELIKVFTSTSSKHVKEVVTAPREGGRRSTSSRGLTAGNFSAYWMGVVIVTLMGIASG